VSCLPPLFSWFLFFTEIKKRLWWKHFISHMELQHLLLMKPHQQDNSLNHGNKVCTKRNRVPFLLFLLTGRPNLPLMLLIEMIPFMTSMASPSPCTRYPWWSFLSFFQSVLLFDSFDYFVIGVIWFQLVMILLEIKTIWLII